MSSLGSRKIIPGYAAVGASKAAIETITRYLAVELAPIGIRVNAVSPGVVWTDALEHFDVAQDDSVIKRVSSITPAGRLVTPEDVADLVAFLCSQEANMIRGQTIVIDGGFILLGDQSSR